MAHRSRSIVFIKDRMWVLGFLNEVKHLSEEVFTSQSPFIEPFKQKGSREGEGIIQHQTDVVYRLIVGRRKLQILVQLSLKIFERSVTGTRPNLRSQMSAEGDHFIQLEVATRCLCDSRWHSLRPRF